MAEYKSNYTGEQIDAAIAKANTALQEELEPAFNASASKDITSQDISNWNNKYDKSSAGIPKIDLAQAVQDSLNLADSAIQPTDYANFNTGGIIKLSTNHGTQISDGILISRALTYADYASLYVNGFISKGTLENVITGKQLVNQTDILGKEDTSNKVTTIDNTSTDTQYASAKAIYDLVSGISGGGGITNENFIETVSSGNPIIFDELAEKGIYFFTTSVQWLYYKTSSSATQTFLNFQNEVPVFIIITKKSADYQTNDVIGRIYSISNNGQINFYKLVNYGSYINKEGNVQGYLALTSYEQNINGLKIFNTIPRQYGDIVAAPTRDNEFTNKKYVDDKPTTYTGYDATKTQVLKNINGTLTWVDE